MIRASEAEIVIGIVARIGVDTKSVVKTAERILTEYGYKAVQIKATDAILELDKFSAIDLSNTEARYTELIKACNKVREMTADNEIMAKFAVSRILHERGTISSDGSRAARTAFIINQLKRPEEADLLRSIYGEHYVQIACHAKQGARAMALARKISNDNPRKPKGADWHVSANVLMRRDEVEEDNVWGQRLRDVFPLSDVTIDASESKKILSELDRFFRALFGDPRITPTPDEYGMQLARTASLRSSDLSRQVGAAVLNRYHEVQALGCNEVPRPYGGTYWEGDKGDRREFQLGFDSNEERKREVFADLLSRLHEAGILKGDINDIESLPNNLLNRTDNIISDAQMMDSLEYGRSIHAEMNAITDAARGGHSVRGCVLYSTTFPCHNCAKHIIASGMMKVVYSVPFPKSFAEDMFQDSILVDPDFETEGRVIFSQFLGISGPMFGRVFEKRRWKEKNGSVRPFEKSTATFVRKTPAPAYAEAEAIIADELRLSLEAAKLSVRTGD